MTLFPSPITVDKVTGVYVNGEWTPTLTPVTFSGSVQPVSAHELLALDIGRTNVGKLKVYSNQKMFISRNDTNKSGDIIKWDGRIYEVIMENNYNNGIIGQYWKYFCELRPDNYQGEVPA